MSCWFGGTFTTIRTAITIDQCGHHITTQVPEVVQIVGIGYLELQLGSCRRARHTQAAMEILRRWGHFLFVRGKCRRVLKTAAMP